MPRARNASPEEQPKRKPPARKSPVKKPPRKTTAKAQPGKTTTPAKAATPEEHRRGLSLVERVRVAQRIATSRAKPKPDTWKVIARREGMTERNAQYIHTRFLEDQATMSDPAGMKVLNETLGLYNEVIVELAVAVRDADMWTARIGAARSLMDALKDRVELLLVMGWMPRSVNAADDAQRTEDMLRRMAEVLERHEVAPEIVMDLISAIRPADQRRALPAAA